jgi:hypothetical protein
VTSVNGVIVWYHDWHFGGFSFTSCTTQERIIIISAVTVRQGSEQRLPSLQAQMQMHAQMQMQS